MKWRVLSVPDLMSLPVRDRSFTSLPVNDESFTIFPVMREAAVAVPPLATASAITHAATEEGKRSNDIPWGIGRVGAALEPVRLRLDTGAKYPHFPLSRRMQGV